MELKDLLEVQGILEYYWADANSWSTNPDLELPNLDVWYKFNDDVTDEQGAADGTATAITYTSGKLNNCAVLNGSSSYVTASGSVFELNTSYTISMWVYCAGSHGTTEEILTSRAGENHYLIRRRSDGKIDFFDWTGGGTQKQCTSNSAVTQDTWVHVMAIRDNTSLTLYINNIAQTDTDTTAGTLVYTDNDIYVGSNNGASGGFLTGRVDDMRFYSRALSSDEREGIYNSGNGKELNYASWDEA